MCSVFTSPFPTKSRVNGDVIFIQTWYGLYKPDCVFWIWPECQSQRLGFFDGSSNWGFTYTSYYSFSYIFNVNLLHTFYHVFVNPSPLNSYLGVLKWRNSDSPCLSTTSTAYIGKIRPISASISQIWPNFKFMVISCQTNNLMRNPLKLISGGKY